MPDSTRRPPARFCDIVMKGGITSGVVYPLAVVELARAFRFRSVGGTSAGAIAAAATAAAELGREHGGFERLALLPAWLGATAPGPGRRSNLFALFQPAPATRPFFAIAVAVLEARGPKWLALLGAALRAGWPWALLGGALGLALLLSAGPNLDGARAMLAYVAGAVLALSGACAALAVWLWNSTARALHGNAFGLCTGRTTESAGAPALTDWLHGYLNELAGRPADGPPLTFGDLWRWPASTEAARRSDRATAGDAAIHLEMMTTSLSHGRPYRLPFRIDDDVRDPVRFAFDPEELERFFPDTVVDWMVTHSDRTDPLALRTGRLVPLPRPEDFPVVVATRMSLSFPVLLSMVPLWAVDTRAAARQPEHCWFSDGGLCSNFPVHFFDSALPRWPTFAINLVDVQADGEAPGASLPSNNRAGLEESWIRFDGPRPRASILGFLRAMQVTSQNWNDLILTRMPGQRDRMATITLLPHEGGLNLNMPRRTITALAERGRDAGRRFVERFKDANPRTEMGWANHRWIRLRSLLEAHEEWLERIRVACERPEAGDVPYEEWIAGDDAPDYRWSSPEQRAEAQARLGGLLAEARRVRAVARHLAPGSPEPSPEMRVRPRV